VASAHAGVGVVTPQVEAEALRLWKRFCDSGSNPFDGGNDGGIVLYCKFANENVTENQEHSLDLPRSPGGQQVIFVQPPSVHTKHDVVVTGGGGAAPKTVIYVKPAKNTNEVNIVDQTQASSAPQKPSLYFLKDTEGEESPNVRISEDLVFRRPNAERSQDFVGTESDNRGGNREESQDVFGGGDRTDRRRNGAEGKNFRTVRVTRRRNDQDGDQDSRHSTRGADGSAPQPIIQHTNEFNIVDQTLPASDPQTPSIFFFKKKREADQSSNNTYRVTQSVSVHSSRAAHQVSQ
jgi:hypothetical protein